MVGQWKSEGMSVRFGAYIDELREFLKSRGVRFGSPVDVVAFAERVNAPGPFQDEMGSMVRSILFQEDDGLGGTELLDRLLVAVGGPERETATPEAMAAARQVLGFVSETLRARNRMFTSGFQGDEDAHLTAGDVLAAASARDEGE